MRGNKNNRDSSNNSYGNSSLYRELRERVSRLTFPAFQILVLLWLRAKGYSHLSSLGRLHRRGRRSKGGADYLALFPGPSNLPIAISIRHWKTPVQRRVVDELYGFLLRHEIPMGLIVSSAPVARKAYRTPTEFPGRQIQLVSLSQLVGSMAGLRLGVTDPTLSLDERFFQMLDQVSVANRLTLPRPRSMRSRRSPCPALDSGEVAMHPHGDPDGHRLWFAIGVAVILVMLLLLAIRGVLP